MKKGLLISVIVIGVAALGYTLLNQEKDNNLSDVKSSNQVTPKNTNQNSEKSQGSLEATGDQQQSFPYAILFYLKDQLHQINFESDGFSQPNPVSNPQSAQTIENDKYFTTSVMPKDILNALPISDGMIFYTGLQSNTDPSLWFYIERADEKQEYNVWMYHSDTKKSTLLFNRDTSPNSDFAFKPFAISKDNKTVYLEGLIFDSYDIHKAVYAYNVETKKSTEIPLHAYYSITPVLSPNDRYLTYSAASEPVNVHTTPNQLFIYDLKQKEETRIFSDEKTFIGLEGWIKAQ
ncbi:hypothetical protein CW751_06245 [Brumimicrobium salinarum]|uniref:Uncharacterized protein n=1 Tax=Brumimicrobium salinarum TaxID=2058658 RepID=A0A2I0R3P0_9FLAO|nr:hypothetical protein [Brumimicrobium salinarum]PKR81182.1 hypothetical protein CW751_06245 [Brumimicrobium salinarum]